jgi:hypothetical protein
MFVPALAKYMYLVEVIRQSPVMGAKREGEAEVEGKKVV